MLPRRTTSLSVARFATTDPDVATQLAAERLAELEDARRHRAFHGGRAVETQLGAFARLHLIAKKKSGKFTDTWLSSSQLYLERAVSYFGSNRELDTIRVSDVRAWIAHLEATPTSGRRRLRSVRCAITSTPSPTCTGAPKRRRSSRQAITPSRR